MPARQFRLRKSTPRVKGGRTQKKHRWRRTPDNFRGAGVAIERCRPGQGFRHAVTQSEVYDFLQLIPRWNELPLDLNRIILDRGSHTRFGWFRHGTIAICAMPVDLQVGLDDDAFNRDRDFFVHHQMETCRLQDLDPSEWIDEPEFEGCTVRVRFSRAQAKCFLLLRTLLHELGHHLDLITTHNGRCTRGEAFAEKIRNEFETAIWPTYIARFGDPRDGH